MDESCSSQQRGVGTGPADRHDTIPETATQQDKAKPSEQHYELNSL